LFNFVIMIDRLKELQGRSPEQSLEMGERQPILNESDNNAWSSCVPSDSWDGRNPGSGKLDAACRRALADIEEIGRATDEIEQLRQKLNISANDHDIQSYLRQVDVIMKRTNKMAGKLKDDIKSLKAENDEYKSENSGSIEIMWRDNSLRTVVKKFQTQMSSYSKSLNDFNRTTVNRCVRQHRYLNSNLTQEDIEDMELDPIRAHQELIQKLEEYGVSEGTVDRIANLEEQNTQMREIEKGVNLIARLFEEMNIMVIEQGDALDSIENNVEATRLYVKKGAEQIDKASSSASKARKKKVCVCILCLAILVVVVMVWLI